MSEFKIDLHGMTLVDVCKAYPEQVAKAIEQHSKEHLCSDAASMKQLIAVSLSKIELYISTGRGEYLEDSCNYLHKLLVA